MQDQGKQEIQELTHKLLAEKIRIFKNSVFIQFSVIGNKCEKEEVFRWFTHLKLFKPTRMGLLGKYARYDETRLRTAIMSNSQGAWSIEDRSHNNIHVCISATASFHAWLNADIWSTKKDDILSFLDSFFVNSGACYGYVVNAFDHQMIQNTTNPTDYEFHGVTDSDFPGIREIPLVPSGFPTTPFRPDPSCLPGAKTQYDHLQFVVAPYMWVGPEFYAVVDENVLSDYDQCEENIEFAPNCRRICLWENLYEYNAPIYRQRQWAFREKTNWAEAMKHLSETLPIYYKKDNQNDAQVEFYTGKFPHGGTLLCKFYVDAHGAPCPKSEAYACVQREMKGNDIVYQERILL